MNQKCYIITFEGSNISNVAALEAAIRAYGNWAKITTNTWAIVTIQSAVQVRDSLSPYLTGGRIFVIKSGLEAAWMNVFCNNEWLKNNL